MVSGEIGVIQAILSKQFLSKQIFVQTIFVKIFRRLKKANFWVVTKLSTEETSQ